MWLGKLFQVQWLAFALLSTSAYGAPQPIWIEGGHSKAVVELKVDSLSSNLVSACADGSVKIWSLSSGAFQKTLYGNTNVIRLMDLALNGARVAALTDVEELILWDVASGRLEERWSGFSRISCFTFSADGSQIITGSADTNDPAIRIWSVPGGKLERTLTGHSGVITSLSLSYFGETLYSTSLDSTIREWDLITGELKNTTVRPTPVINGVSVGTRFIVPQPLTLARYSLPDWDPIQSIPSNVPNVQKLTWSRKDQVLAAASEGRFGIGYFESDLGVESEVIVVDYPQRFIPAVVPTTGQRFAFGGLGGKVIERHFGFAEYVRNFGHFTSSVEVVQFNPAVTRIVLGAGGELHLFRSVNGEHLGTFPHSNVTDASFSPNGLLLASSDLDKKVRLWSVSDQSLIRTLAFHSGPVKSIAFSPNGLHFASGGADKTIRVWNTNSASPARTITGPSGIERVSYSVDGGTIFSGDSDGSLRFWRAFDGQLMNSISAHQHAISDFSISPDGNFLATCSAAEADLKVWRVREGSLLASINTGSPIVSCAFSPDSMSVAGVVLDPEKRWSSGELRIWRVQDRAILHSLTNELQRAESISWAKNGVLAAGRLDAVALLFSLPPPEPKAPTLNPVHLIDSGSLRLGVTADAGTTLRLQSTTNFLQWLERTNVAANGTEQWFDFPLSTNSQEFFRAFSE